MKTFYDVNEFKTYITFFMTPLLIIRLGGKKVKKVTASHSGFPLTQRSTALILTNDPKLQVSGKFSPGNANCTSCSTNKEIIASPESPGNFRTIDGAIFII